MQRLGFQLCLHINSGNVQSNHFFLNPSGARRPRELPRGTAAAGPRGRGLPVAAHRTPAVRFCCSSDDLYPNHLQMIEPLLFLLLAKRLSSSAPQSVAFSCLLEWRSVCPHPPGLWGAVHRAPVSGEHGAKDHSANLNYIDICDMV